MSESRHPLTIRTVARFSLQIDERRGVPIYDMDAPAYLASGDIDNAPIIGYSDCYRAVLNDTLSEKRVVLESSFALTPDSYTALADHIALELKHYLTKHYSEPLSR